jgi:hypothetical protein
MKEPISRFPPLLPIHPRKRGPLHLPIQLEPTSDRKRFRHTVHVPKLPTRSNPRHTTRPCEERPGPGPITQYNKPKRIGHHIVRLRNTPLRTIHQVIHRIRGPGDHALAIRDRRIIRCIGLQRLYSAGRSSSPGPDREERQALIIESLLTDIASLTSKSMIFCTIWINKARRSHLYSSHR